MKLQPKKKTSGFTIIEVLIVLAIAGLIMLIVFLAVPALQRNSRNTARKNDAGRIGGAANEFLSNNNGRVPASGDNGTLTTSAGTLNQYTASDITVSAVGAGVGPLTDITKMQVVTGAKCGTTQGTAVGGSSTRAMVVLYLVETTGGSTPLCQEV